MSVQSLNLFSMPIAKFTVDKWESKKDKLLKLISFEDCDVVECQTDYYKYNTISPYLDDFVNIITSDLNGIVEYYTQSVSYTHLTLPTKRIV